MGTENCRSIEFRRKSLQNLNENVEHHLNNLNKNNYEEAIINKFPNVQMQSTQNESTNINKQPKILTLFEFSLTNDLKKLLKHRRNITVYLIGTFTNWKKAIEMNKSKEKRKYFLVMDLLPGKYEFRFIINQNYIISNKYPTISSSDGAANNFLDNTESKYQYKNKKEKLNETIFQHNVNKGNENEETNNEQNEENDMHNNITNDDIIENIHSNHNQNIEIQNEKNKYENKKEITNINEIPDPSKGKDMSNNKDSNIENNDKLIILNDKKNKRKDSSNEKPFNNLSDENTSSTDNPVFDLNDEITSDLIREQINQKNFNYDELFFYEIENYHPKPIRKISQNEDDEENIIIDKTIKDREKVKKEKLNYAPPYYKNNLKKNLSTLNILNKNSYDDYVNENNCYKKLFKPFNSQLLHLNTCKYKSNISKFSCYLRNRGKFVTLVYYKPDYLNVNKK